MITYTPHKARIVLSNPSKNNEVNVQKFSSGRNVKNIIPVQLQNLYPVDPNKPNTPKTPNYDSSDGFSDEDLNAYQTPDSTAVPPTVPSETDAPTSEQSQLNVDQGNTPCYCSV